MPELLLIDFLIACAVVGVILGFGTQVVIPVFFDRPLFPIFRRRQKVKELQQANDEVDSIKLDKQIRDAKRQAERMREPAQVIHIVDVKEPAGASTGEEIEHNS